MSSNIKIALVDDELLFRKGLLSILQEEGFDILFDAENGNDLLQKLRDSKEQPHIVITDLKMPELNGVEVTKIIRKEFPEIKIIALTSYFSKPFILNMISLGAVAYLAKNSTPKLMLKTIREVHRNGFYYDEKVLKYIHENLSKTKEKIVKSNFDANYFTTRELQVLELICKQLTAKDIAKKLFISDRTAEGHRSSLLIKTGSKNIAGLVVFALKNKLIDLDNENTFK